LVNELAAHDKSFGIGGFSQSVYYDLLANNVKNIKPLNEESVEKGLEQLNIHVAFIRT
jgi:hypothetical protein